MEMSAVQFNNKSPNDLDSISVVLMCIEKEMYDEQHDFNLQQRKRQLFKCNK